MTDNERRLRDALQIVLNVLIENNIWCNALDEAQTLLDYVDDEE